MVAKKMLGLVSSICLFAIALFSTGCYSHTSSSNLGKGLSELKRIGDVPKKENSWFKLHFINEREGWLGCGKKLWRTTDGGRDWEAIYSANNSWNLTDYIMKIEFTSSQAGWMLVSPGKLFKTEDGGFTWILQENVPMTFPKGILSDVKFAKDGKTGWISGGIHEAGLLKNSNESFNFDLRAAIFRTIDGGKSWIEELVPPGDSKIEELFFLDDHGWAIGDRGFFYLGTDKSRWKRSDYAKGNCNRQLLLHTTQTGREDGDIYEPVAIHFIDTNQGWLSFKNGYMANTTDGGQTWCDILDPSTVWLAPSYDTFFWKIHFTNSTDGWGLSGEGSIYETNDGGMRWQKTSLSAKVEDMYFSDSNHGWVVTNEGLFFISH